MAYSPNFQDPRVRQRIESSVNWVNTYLKPNKDQWLSTREIQRQFGSQSRPLGLFLKNTLLICVNDYYNNLNGQCKTYRLNQEGLERLSEKIGYKAKILIPQQIQRELDTGEFQYKDQGHREYHWLQNLPKRKKVKTLCYHGYRHEYDIQCCAQTLVLQHARAQGFKTPTPRLDEYITDRTTVRKAIAQRTGLDTTTVKKILTAIFNGASISCWHTNMIFAQVNYNRKMMAVLREDPYICEYQKELRAMWKSIRQYQNLSHGQRFNSKMKSEIYRFLEESVRVVIKRHLKKTHNRSLIEHDGWSSETAVDIDRLCFEVRQQTGFVIKLDWTIHEYVDCY